MASAEQVLRDCIRDGKLDGTYSNAELRKARDNLPSDSDEYSDCSEVIAAAIKGGSNRGSGAGSPGVGATDPAGEAAARTDDAGDLAAIASGNEDAPSVDVGGTSLAPDSSGFFNLGGAANQVPLPLLVALILLALFAMASGAAALRERIPALARIPLLSKLPTLRVPFFQRRQLAQPARSPADTRRRPHGHRLRGRGWHRAHAHDGHRDAAGRGQRPGDRRRVPVGPPGG